KENSSVSQTSNINIQKEIFVSKIPEAVDEDKDIVLTKEEIQIYIDQEIKARISDNPQVEIDLFNLDSLFEEAAQIIVVHQQASTSLVQRKLKLGYNRAGKLIDELEFIGVVGAFDGQRAR